MTDDVDHPSDALLRLAELHGITTDFWDYHGRRQTPSASTLRHVLGALGVDAGSPALVDLALRNAEDTPWRQVLPPFVVTRQGRSVHVPVHVTDGDPVRAWVEIDPDAGGGRRDLEQADAFVEPRTVDGRRVGRATFALPDDLPLGYHEVVVEGPSAQGHSPAVVTPARLTLTPALGDSERVWGLMAQLYSVRSRDSWGVGDLVDLADIAWLTGRECGADFLLINPLHAAEPTTPMTPSPYLPTTRRFVNPLFVRPEAVREAAYLSSADRALVEWAAEPARALNTDTGPIDRDVAWTAKKAALEVVFAAPRTGARQRAFEAYCAEEGTGLDTFALWSALAERYAGQDWPDEAWDLSSPLVAAARTELADRVEFFRWLQWVADEQLAAAQAAARTGGMALGIMHDLAVGVHPGGADAWALRDVLAPEASVGAPPDMYNQQGQDWSQPPWHPQELARAGYRPWRDMLRTILRHAGAIRIDHVIGLFRLWWIPRGQSPALGAYVKYDHEAIVGILALEAHRAGTVVIGEDLGTVEPWVRDYLSERGVLGTSILWFEYDDQGGPLAPEKWRRLVLATVTTHDLPPTAGYLADEHVAIRERLGLLTEPVDQVRAQAAEERERMLGLLRGRGLLGEDPSEREVVEALHRYIQASPAALLGVSLADAVGERRAQNQPGTDQEYPNWKVPLADGSGRPVLVEDLVESSRLRSLARVMNGS
ncbi:4-alpha-glucanotransferase [Cellulomonas marina]|uniref:4-alpha-glucanotransferase n=1 Tax=Cellulomonas marina TaxID=988821 RepID=A0A1I0VB80_9CELL|nr:4-alpha-glucanotransferase [Cellulomonas marina]SFA72846.1 4-alpha-glucanotransferase [Cellulomonas marina]